MVPFWVPIIIRHLLFRAPEKGTLILTTTHMKRGSSMAHSTPGLLSLVALVRSRTGLGLRSFGLEDYDLGLETGV